MYTKSTCKDIYQQVTDAVIESLENGDIIWLKSWNSFGLPKNITTGKQYRGWNIFWFNFHTLIKTYKTPFYLTFHQAQKLGGSIRIGERGTRITYWATMEDKKTLIELKNSATGETTTKHPERLIPTLHTVFNIDQTEGIAFPKVEALFRSNTEKILACDHVIQSMPLTPSIRHQGYKAYYILQTDQVTIPDLSLFHTSEAYYSTLFHELAHSTGHASRLNRKELLEYDGFGGKNYSKEELTAELTVAFLSAFTGIRQLTLTNSVAYIKGWLTALHNDKKLVLTAAAQAQKAADYILGKDAAS